MNCEGFADLLGYHCASLEGGGVVLTTPFTMPSGTSIPVYIEPIANTQYRLWDAGELLYEAIVSGARIPDRRRLRGLSSALQQLGATISEDGSIEIVIPQKELPNGFARFIEAALEVARWNERVVSEPSDHEDFLDEVHQLLIATRPNKVVERNVSLEGFSRRPLVFDFRQNGRLIDCISGTPRASAFEVRKLLDLRSLSAYADTDVLVVVEDRVDPAKAAQEMVLISRLANTQSFSDLRRVAGSVETMQ